jgi:hypothetical protein
MNRAEAEELRTRLEAIIRAGWGERDPDVRVSGNLRADTMIDITVISELFAGKSGLEREAYFWPVFATVPRADLIHMTYCLLLTPAEAAQQFATGTPVSDQHNREDWDA